MLKSLLKKILGVLTDKDGTPPIIRILLRISPFLAFAISAIGLLSRYISIPAIKVDSLYGLSLIANLLIIAYFCYVLYWGNIKKIYDLEYYKGFVKIFPWSMAPSRIIIERSRKCVKFLFKKWIFILLSVWCIFYVIELVDFLLIRNDFRGIFIDSNLEQVCFNICNSIESIAYLGIVIIMACPTYNNESKKSEMPQFFYFFCLFFFILIILDFIFWSCSVDIKTFLPISISTIGGMLTCVLLAILVGKIDTYPFISRIRYLSLIYFYAGIQALYPYYKSQFLNDNDMQFEILIYSFAFIGKLVLLSVLAQNLRSSRFHYYFIFQNILEDNRNH